MATFSGERAEAERLLQGLESGRLTADQAFAIIENLDDFYCYFVVRFLREKHAGGGGDSAGVIDRLVELGGSYADVARKMKACENDSLVEWFDDAYSMRDFVGREGEFIDLIDEKING